MDVDCEFDTMVVEMDKGRKSRTKTNKPRGVKGKMTAEPNIKCSHGLDCSSSNSKSKGNKECNVADLTYEDIRLFHNKIQSLCKIDQDKLLLKFMVITSPKRRVVKRETAKRKQTVSIKYSVRKTNGQIVPICASSFRGITGMSKDRLTLLASRFHSTGQQPKENRGGDTTGKKHQNLTIAVKNDIKTYKCRESHYTRGKSSRGYLPPQLSIKRMWNQFCEKRRNLGLHTCSLSKYKHIFYKCFNLSFKTPHTDTCSTCKVGLLKIKEETDLMKKNEHRTLYRLHKICANKFYSIMKEENADVIKIVFDLQQNQPLPKLSVSEVFYSRQVWLYNLCILIHSKMQQKENVSFYTWLETQSSRGCNQVSSALLDFLTKLEERTPRSGRSTIHLFSDSCASQNKNSIMMAMLIAFLERSRIFTRILHFFPIRGHSYMAPDRVFGRIEKQYRRMEDITTPSDYHKILENHGILNILNKDWKIKDLKSSAQKLLKATLPFKMTPQRVITYSRHHTGNVSVAVQSTYTASPVEVSVLKEGMKMCSKTMYQSSVLPEENMVSKEKKKDVKKLLQYFKMTEEAKDFYNTVLAE